MHKKYFSRSLGKQSFRVRKDVVRCIFVHDIVFLEDTEPFSQVLKTKPPLGSFEIIVVLKAVYLC